jgi:Family of unknown function (DUF6011)
MSIRCGSCKGRHESVAEIRRCSQAPQRDTFYQDAADRGSITQAQADRYTRNEQRSYVPAPPESSRYYPQDYRPEAPRSARVTEDGMYRNPKNGDIFKVQKAVHGSGNLYAKRLVIESEPVRGGDGAILEPAVVRFDYAPGQIFRLAPEWRMTLEEAKKFGALYGTCVRCGRTLTREDSIERMMGAVCAGKGNWA